MLIVLLVIVVPLVAISVPGFLLLWDMRRKAQGLTGFARGLRRLRDESRASGTDFRPTARAAKAMLGN